VMETLVWMRVPGDIVFAGGVALLAWYALNLLRRPRQQIAAVAGLPQATGR
jgi:nitric oxide reductase subunit B